MNIHQIKKVLDQENTLSADEWKGAVLFLCTEEHVFFIKRSEFMPTHAGQMAFVGGHRQAGEETPWIVAQREFEEETSQSREVIEFLGYLPLTYTARLQPIAPVVARLKIDTHHFLKETKSNGEWDDILAYPWSELTVEENWQFAWRNGLKEKSPMMFHTIRMGSYLPEEKNKASHLLWGATAGMVFNLLRKYFNSGV